MSSSIKNEFTLLFTLPRLLFLVSLVFIGFLLYFQQAGIAGVLIGACLTRYFFIQNKETAYIINVQNVLLILIKQLNEFEAIKKHINNIMPNKGPVNISDTEWRLSKTEILGLNNDDAELLGIIYDLIFIDKYYKDMILAVEDHRHLYQKIFERKLRNEEQSISKLEDSELQRYLVEIQNRVEKLDRNDVYGLLYMTKKTCEYFHKRYPYKKFPQPRFD